jgi:hypothetical protein
MWPPLYAACWSVSYEKDDAKRRIANMSGAWIPVTERLPEEGVVVLAFLPRQGDVESGVFAAVLSELQTLKGTFSTSFGFGFEASHWMPLPAPPTDAK